MAPISLPLRRGIAAICLFVSSFLLPSAVGAQSDMPSAAEVREALETLRRFERALVQDAVHEDGTGVVGKGLVPTHPPRRGTTPRFAGEPLTSGTLGAPSSQQTVMAPGSFALALDGSIDLNGFVFKEGYPFIHNDGGSTHANTALGLNALANVTPGQPAGYGRLNTAIGRNALYFNTEGHRNTALGVGALFANTKGNYNTATGFRALQDNDDPAGMGFGLGSFNSAHGALALYSNTTGGYNTAAGAQALSSNTTGNYNTAVGQRTLANATDASSNTAVGQKALESNQSGFNTAVGRLAQQYSTSGFFNTSIGAAAGQFWESGSSNIAVGRGAMGSANESGVIRIGGNNFQTFTYIEGINSQALAGDPVCITANDRLGLCPPAVVVQSGLSHVSPQLWEQLRRQDAQLSELRQIVAEQRRRLEQLERER